jgi:hypothetical protein
MTEAKDELRDNIVDIVEWNDYIHKSDIKPEELKLISDEEMEKLLGEDFSTAYSGHVNEYHIIAQAQLKYCQEQLREMLR